MTLKTIGQLAKKVGLRTSTLRYYEDQALLIPTDRSESGYRLYDVKAEQTLHLIQRAQRLGFSLADIRTLLKGWQAGNLSDEAVIATAEARYLAVERQLTQLLVLQHELGLFLQDVHRNRADRVTASANTPFDQLLDKACRNPFNRPVGEILNWLIEHTGCALNTVEARALLTPLRGQHVHVWQEDDAFHILIPNNDPAIGTALKSLAQLEADCQAHVQANEAPELTHNDEGYLFITRGEHAFIFARLFLVLEQDIETHA